MSIPNVDFHHRLLDSYGLFESKEPMVSYDPHPNVTTHGLRSGYGWLSPLLTHQTGAPGLKTSEMQRIFDLKPYDVVHYHNMSLLGPKALSMVPRQQRAVKVYTAHEHWLVCPTHVLWKFNARPCERPACLSCTLMAKRPPQLWRYTGLLDRESASIDRFVAPSRFSADMHKARGFSREVGVLPYFTYRCDDDWKVPSSRPQKRPYFLFVGRLEKIKGLQRLIEAWSRISGADLLVAGAGTYERKLRTQAEPNPRIRFLGPQTQKELGLLYRHARACIVPSITYETFGIILIEAFARKTPVIAHDLGALTEVVEESRGGLLYRSTDELVSAIDALRASDRLCRELGENGYTSFLANWTLEVHLKKYFDILEDAGLSKRGLVRPAHRGAKRGLRCQIS